MRHVLCIPRKKHPRQCPVATVCSRLNRKFVQLNRASLEPCRQSSCRWRTFRSCWTKSHHSVWERKCPQSQLQIESNTSEHIDCNGPLKKIMRFVGLVTPTIGTPPNGSPQLSNKYDVSKIETCRRIARTAPKNTKLLERIRNCMRLNSYIPNVTSTSICSGSN